MSLSVPHAVAVWRRNASMYRRTWKWNILPNFFEPVFYLLSIGLGVGAYINQMGGGSYLAFLAPGLVCVAAILSVHVSAKAGNMGNQLFKRILLTGYFFKELVHLCLLSKHSEDVEDGALATTL